MRNEILRIGGLVHLEPERDQQLSRLAADFGEAQFAEWLREYRAGQWVLACMEMFADVLSDDGVTRICDGSIRRLTFGVPHDEDNVVQARDAAAQYVDDLAIMLHDNHVDVAPGELERLPIVIELDPDMELQLSV